MPESSIVVRPESPDSSSYTAASRLQAAGLQPAIDLFVRAAELVPVPEPPAPVLIADYGAATGHNALLPVRAARNVARRRFDVTFEAPVTGTDARAMMAEVNRRIGAWIEAAPEQWFWFHRRWRSTTRSRPVYAEEEA